jgi:hypothetical protein
MQQSTPGDAHDMGNDAGKKSQDDMDMRRHKAMVEDMIAKSNQLAESEEPSLQKVNRIPPTFKREKATKKPVPLDGDYGRIFYSGRFKPSKELISKERERHDAQHRGDKLDRQIRTIEDGLCRKYHVQRLDEGPDYIPNTMANGKNVSGHHALVMGNTCNDPQHPKMWGISQLDRTFHAHIVGATGSGKNLPRLTYVLSSHGWEHIGDLSIGDLVYTRNGTLAQVNGIYPQGKQRVWEIEFEDGTVIQCGADHQWIDARLLHGMLKETVKTTEQMYQEGIRQDDAAGKKSGNGYRHHMPVPKPMQFPEQSLPLDPYVLGCFLSDGCMLGYNSTSLPTFSSANIEIIKRLSDKLNENYDFIQYKDTTTWNIKVSSIGKRNIALGTIQPLGAIFKALGVRLHSEHKFIPDIYKYSSIEQRRELVRGLMDTDGSASKGRFTYASISKQLRDDLAEVLRSLGYIVYLGVDDRGIDKYPNSDGKAYTLHVSGSDVENLFSLSRKQQDYYDYVERKSASAVQPNVRNEPVMFDDATLDTDLLLPPYLVGLLCHANITTSGVIVTNTSEDMRQHVCDMFLNHQASWHIHKNGKLTRANRWELDVDGGTQRNGKHLNLALHACRQLGLECPIARRVIPYEYMHAGYAARQELLQGILDIRGKFSGQMVELYGSDIFLSQVKELAESLGYVVKSYTPPNGINYVTIRIADEDMFFDPAKRKYVSDNLDRCLSTRRREHDDTLAIVDIRKTDRYDDQVCISVDDPTHSYIIEGYIVTHNSTFLRSLLVQDMWYNRGGLLLEPHGDLSLELLEETPPYRLHNVVYMDTLGDKEYSPGFNPLAIPPSVWLMPDDRTKDLRAQAVSGVVSLIAKHFSMDSGAVQLKKNLENALNALVWCPGATLLEVMDFYTNEDVRKTVLACMPEGAEKERIQDAASKVKASDLGSLDNRISVFQNNMNMKRMFGQSKPTMNFYKLMNEGYMLICPLNKGVSDDDSFRNFVGAYIISSIYHDSMKRESIPQSDRVIFPLTIDEFQNFAGDDVAGMLSECRKYGLPLMLANQYMGQLNGTVQTAVQQCGTKMYLKLTSADAQSLSHTLGDNVTALELANIKKFHAVVQTTRNSQVTEPFMSANLNLASIEETLQHEPSAQEISKLVIEISHKRFMKSSQEIDAEIDKRHEMLAGGASRDELLKAFVFNGTEEQ